MNTYKAFYKNETLTLTAKSSYSAQLQAASMMGAKKSHEVTIMLLAKNGKQVTHAPLF